MVKGNPKSSATSATRKKHAKKNTPLPPDDVPNDNKRPKTKAERAKAKKEPRVKMYIPPVKPGPIQPDPLETTGLAHSLPADLLVVLRNVSKKAQVTKIRALEELQANWVDKCLKERGEGLEYTIVDMLPVWLHHVSSLFVHPSRRVRFIAASLHASLLHIPPVCDQIFLFFRETGSASQISSVLGTWCLAAHDIDRGTSSAALKSWKENISNDRLNLDENLHSSLTSFLQRTALDPDGVYISLNPLPPPIFSSTAHGKKSQTSGRVLSSTSTPRRDDGDQTPRSKVDEQEESDTDRRARLRIAALNATKWILGSTSTLAGDLTVFLSNPALWTALYPTESAPWIPTGQLEAFGCSQPNVRKAGWGLVQSLLGLPSKAEQIVDVVPALGNAILRSAWVELDVLVQASMWQPLLVFLNRYPQSWALDAQADRNDEEDSDAGSEEDKNTSPSFKRDPGSAEAYQEYLRFLESGCSGSPAQGYPTVVVILSTIPGSIMEYPFSSDTSSNREPLSSSPFSGFFASFWAAIDSRALSSLHRATASAAFLSSLLECLVFLAKRLRNQPTASSAASILHAEGQKVEQLVTDQLSRVWSELANRRLRAEERAAGRLLARTLENLLALDETLLVFAWDTIAKGIKGSLRDNPVLPSAVLKNFYDRWRNEQICKERVCLLIRNVLVAGIEYLEEGLGSQRESEDPNPKVFDLLVNMLDQFREGLFFDAEISLRLDSLVSKGALSILKLSPSFLLSFLQHRKDQRSCLSVWHSLLASIASSFSLDLPSKEQPFVALLTATQKGQLPSYLKPQSAELDGLVGTLLERVLTGEVAKQEEDLVRSILISSGYFLSNQGYHTFLETIVAAFNSQVERDLQGEDVPMSLFEVVVDLIQGVFKQSRDEVALTLALLPNAFIFAYLLPICHEVEVDTTPVLAAKVLWDDWVKSAPEETKFEVIADINSRLEVFMDNTTVRVVPESILQMLEQNPPGIHFDTLTDLFPSAGELDAMLDELPAEAIDPALTVLDPLIPPFSSHAPDVVVPTDRRGFSGYARLVNALTQALLGDRQLAKRNLWTLRHCIALSIYAQDLKSVPSGADRSKVFDGKVTPLLLDSIVQRVKQLSVYLLGSAAGRDDGDWRRVVLERILNEGSPGSATKKTGKEGLNLLQAFLWDIIGYAKKEDRLRDTRVLKVLLESLLADEVDVAEADLWVQLARKLERSAPQTSMTILSAVTSTSAEPPKLDRYRNELAASLLGIKPSEANTAGLLILRRLAASAPDPEGETVFLPPPRAVNVIKACQAWALAEDADDDDADEDEMNEEVESAMLPIFTLLAPILQNIPGGHWGFVFDVLEGVLERARSIPKEDGEEESGGEGEGEDLVALARALKVVIVLEDLAKRNKALMTEWEGRRMGVLVFIRDLAVLGTESEEVPSVPRSVCRELALSIVQHLPSSLIDKDILPKMAHLIEDPSPTVQKMAYQLLRTAAKIRTEYFVIEAGVDTENAIQPTLPVELLVIIMRETSFGFGTEGEVDSAQNLFGYLLGWMVVFDLFQDASFKVKSGYIEQLRNLDVVVGHFIPYFLALLRLDRGSLLKVFKLDIWAVDQFYVDFYQPGNPHAIPVLAAHVYYRALLTIPSLIHAWVLDCKDRQLTSIVTNYTSSYFSPVLIHAELEHVRQQALSKGDNAIADENMSVKVASAVNEVAAAYSVDDHLLEIKLRIPVDWPLHRVEVRDVKRVGVDENRWRAWVLGVQQTIWAHNGRIADGLSLFKKNVTLHFEGQVECAICYSIISVMDGSLPKKPCKTCKNRFHAGCLYKWFNTSHSSSCPLCRSDII